MSKLKTIFLCVLIAAIAVIVYQNEAFFMTKQVLYFKLFSLNYKTPYMPCGIFIAISVLLTFLIAYINHVIFRIKTNKTIKDLKSKSDIQNKEEDFKNKISEETDSDSI